MAEIELGLRFWTTSPSRGHFQFSLSAPQGELLSFIHQSHKPFIRDDTADNVY